MSTIRLFRVRRYVENLLSLDGVLILLAGLPCLLMETPVVALEKCLVRFSGWSPLSLGVFVD